MKAAYVGILTPGSTSRMRAEWLRRLTPEWGWDWMDTDPPLVTTGRVSQSLAYRLKTGPGVKRINEAVCSWITGKSFDLAWIDKAIFLRPSTIQSLRRSSRRLVHFTPDTAFHSNKSRHFEQTIREFDLLVTTKSFELGEYKCRIDRDTLHLTTQGFDPEVHHPRNADVDRRKEAVFVGLAEPDRERCVATLLDRSVAVRLAGIGWNSFLRKWGDHPMLNFGGETLFGDEYARALSSAWVGLGLLSKRFPELHTTRTFEIPAAGAILATERTSETTSFFSENEACFFEDFDSLAEKLLQLFSLSAESLAELAHAGRHRVLLDGRDYPALLSRIIKDPRLEVGL